MSISLMMLPHLTEIIKLELDRPAYRNFDKKKKQTIFFRENARAPKIHELYVTHRMLHPFFKGPSSL